MDILKDIIYPAMEEMKPSLRPGSTFAPQPTTVLFGNDSALDSLAFVSFIVVVEEKIREVTSKPVTLVDEKAMSQRNSPFRTVESLAAYVATRI